MIHSTLTRSLLYLPAKLYRFIVQARIYLYERNILKTGRLNAPVISVGNLTVGGTGKTPCGAYLANLLRDEGYSVAILSRGYKRESSGIIEVSNGKEILCTSSEAGDEPYLLAKSCPGVRVVVGADRYEAGKWIEERSTISVFILDDAYQHLSLDRDLNLLLFDATEKFDDAEMSPFGRLREPLKGMNRADAVILTRSDRLFDRELLDKNIRTYTSPGTPIFYARHELTSLRRLDDDEMFDISTFAQKPVAAFSGIARPDRFIDDLSNLGMQIVARCDYIDHHRYSREELFGIAGLARDAGAIAIITTEKDAANLPAMSIGQTEIPIYAAQIRFRCEDENALKNLLLRKVMANHS